jgi:hypothetical protein
MARQQGQAGNQENPAWHDRQHDSHQPDADEQETSGYLKAMADHHNRAAD